jgi:hypothetical protein
VFVTIDCRRISGDCYERLSGRWHTTFYPAFEVRDCCVGRRAPHHDAGSGFAELIDKDAVALGLVLHEFGHPLGAMRGTGNFPETKFIGVGLSARKAAQGLAFRINQQDGNV